MIKRYYITEFQTFINVNKLTQKTVSEYLGVSTAFVNQKMKGKCDLPSNKLQKLRESDWDTSMFENRGTDINKQIEDLKKTIAEYERLLTEKDERIKDKDKQIQEKDKQINALLAILNK